MTSCIVQTICAHEKAAKEMFIEADMASAWMKIQIKTDWCFWQMEKYSPTQGMENYVLNKPFWKLQDAAFLHGIENHHACQHLLTGKMQSIPYLQTFQIWNIQQSKT